MIPVDKKELEKMPKETLINIIISELDALNGLINNQQEKIDQLNQNPNRDLGDYFCETNRMSGYIVARDMLVRFIGEHSKKGE